MVNQDYYKNLFWASAKAFVQVVRMIPPRNGKNRMVTQLPRALVQANSPGGAILNPRKDAGRGFPLPPIPCPLLHLVQATSPGEATLNPGKAAVAGFSPCPLLHLPCSIKRKQSHLTITAPRTAGFGLLCFEILSAIIENSIVVYTSHRVEYSCRRLATKLVRIVEVVTLLFPAQFNYGKVFL
jgi:hypothetical protein